MIKVNGKSYYGNNVTVKNGKVYIDGKLADSDNSKEIHINISADINTLEVDCCEDIKILGNVNEVSLTNGDIKIKGDIKGDAKTTNGDISASAIYGKCHTVNGDIKKL